MSDPQTHDRTDLMEPSARRRYTVTAADLPVCCPTPDMYLWSSHPRVYLPVGELGYASCPYCGAIFVLAEADDEGAK